MNRFPVENIDKVAAAKKADNASKADSANKADSASKATQLTTARNIKLTKDVTGSASFDGTNDANITVTIADDLYNHVIGNIDNLQTNLDTLSTNITNAKNASITGLSVSGKVITYTKGDGTTGTITTQDTNTTYSNMTAATSSTAGKAGLVPAPAAGKQTSFLRGDGTWVVPTNTTYSAATSSNLGLVKIGNNITVSSGTISLTKANITSALGYTPMNSTSSTGIKEIYSEYIVEVNSGYNSDFTRTVSGLVANKFAFVVVSNVTGDSDRPPVKITSSDFYYNFEYRADDDDGGYYYTNRGIFCSANNSIIAAVLPKKATITLSVSFPKPKNTLKMSLAVYQ